MRPSANRATCSENDRVLFLFQFFSVKGGEFGIVGACVWLCQGLPVYVFLSYKTDI